MTPISIPLNAPFTQDFVIDGPAEIRVSSNDLVQLLVQRIDAFSLPQGGSSAGVEVTVSDPGTYRVTISPLQIAFVGTLSITDPPPTPE